MWEIGKTCSASKAEKCCHHCSWKSYSSWWGADLRCKSNSEFLKVVERLRQGRTKAMEKTQRRTVMGKKKVEGRKNAIELHPKLRNVLGRILKRPFSNRVLKTGSTISLRKLSEKLATYGVVTCPRKNSEGSKPINSGRLLQWLKHCDGWFFFPALFAANVQLHDFFCMSCGKGAAENHFQATCTCPTPFVPVILHSNLFATMSSEITKNQSNFCNSTYPRTQNFIYFSRIPHAPNFFLTDICFFRLWINVYITATESSMEELFLDCSYSRGPYDGIKAQ